MLHLIFTLSLIGLNPDLCITNALDEIQSVHIFATVQEEKKFIQDFLKDHQEHFGEIYNLYESLSDRQKSLYGNLFQKKIVSSSTVNERLYHKALFEPFAYFRKLPPSWSRELITRGLKSDNFEIRRDALEYAFYLSENGQAIDINFPAEIRRLLKLRERLKKDSSMYQAVSGLRSLTSGVPSLAKGIDFVEEKFSPRQGREYYLGVFDLKPLLKSGASGRALIFEALNTESFPQRASFVELSGQLDDPPIEMLFGFLDGTDDELKSSAARGLAMVRGIPQTIIDRVKEKSNLSHASEISYSFVFEAWQSGSHHDLNDNLRLVESFLNDPSDRVQLGCLSLLGLSGHNLEGESKFNRADTRRLLLKYLDGEHTIFGFRVFITLLAHSTDEERAALLGEKRFEKYRRLYEKNENKEFELPSTKTWRVQ